MDGAADGPEAAMLRLAHLLATRLCHDLSGPLSGLAAALGELPNDPQALDLAGDAAAALHHRLALLRTAWGEPARPLTRDGLRDMALGLPNAARLELDLDGLTERAFPPIAGRLLANLLLLASESLPGGGLLSLVGAAGGPVVTRIAGRRAAWPAGLGALLASAEAAWAAVAALDGVEGVRGLQAPLTAVIAHDAAVPARLLLGAAAEPAPPLLLDLSSLGAV